MIPTEFYFLIDRIGQLARRLWKSIALVCRIIIFSCSYKVLKKLIFCFLPKMKCNWHVRETRGEGAGAGGDRGEVRGLVANNTDTSLLGTACFVPGERTSLHLIRTPCLYGHFLWPPQGPYQRGLTILEEAFFKDMTASNY